MTVADMFTQIWAMTHERPAKKAAARPAGPSQESIMTIGSQTYSVDKQRSALGRERETFLLKEDKPTIVDHVRG